MTRCKDLLLVIVATQLGFHTLPATAKQKPESTERRYEISPDTTHITRPLLGDGSPDFINAEVNRLAEGVTPKNNAARFIFKTVPDSFGRVDPSDILELRRLLDTDSALPMAYPQLLDIQTYAETNKLENLDVHLSDSFREPWSTVELPGLADFIELNDPALDQIVSVTKLERFYVPMQSSEAIESPGVHRDNLLATLPVPHAKPARIIAP